MHNLTGSLGQFERSNTLARNSNLHQHNQFSNYPSLFVTGSGVHKLTNYSTGSNFNTYHPAPSSQLGYPYTATVLGSHRSASGQSLLSGGTGNQLYQQATNYTTGPNSTGFNAHGQILHHLPPSNQSAVLGAGTAIGINQTTGNHPLHFTTSTLSAGAVPQQAHFASLPRTAQSLPATPNVARRSLSPQPSFFAMPVMTTNPMQQTSANRSAATSNLCRTNSGGNPSGRFLERHHYNERNPFIAPLDLAGKFTQKF